MQQQSYSTNFFAGLQWLFFMFANTVVIPITIGEAFDLSSVEVASALQRSFIYTGFACILQAFIGHKYPLMEGQSGLWWGGLLSISASASAAGMSIDEMGGGLLVGIVISGIVIMILGALGIAKLLNRLFTPIVMSTVLFLLGAQLVGIFTKGMLGLSTHDRIDIPTSILSIFLILLVIIVNMRGPGPSKNFSILIGIVVGWILYVIFFPSESTEIVKETKVFNFFPWGDPHFNLSLIIFTVLTGLVNTTNTIASVKGFETMVNKKTSDAQYRRSFMLTGLNSVVSGVFGMVPYAPYVSSLGFLQSTRIFQTLPMMIGGAMFMVLGLVPPLSTLFTTMPVSVGNAVLFVAYLQLFGGALSNLKGIQFNSVTIYRIAAPVLLGIAIMNIPASSFESIPVIIRPLLSSGLLVGIILAVLLENSIRWDKINQAITRKK